MSSYIRITTTRTTSIDFRSLLIDLRTRIDSSVGAADLLNGEFRLKKLTPWTIAEIAIAQNAVDTGLALTPQLVAQHEIDVLSIRNRALFLTLLELINALRNLAIPPLPVIPLDAALREARGKAEDLTDISVTAAQNPLVTPPVTPPVNNPSG